MCSAPSASAPPPIVREVAPPKPAASRAADGSSRQESTGTQQRKVAALDSNIKTSTLGAAGPVAVQKKTLLGQ